MKFLHKKIPLWLRLVWFLVPALPLFVIAFRIVKNEIAIKNVYDNCHLLREGMTLSEFYQVVGNDILPNVEIEFKHSDSSYHHYLIYPPPFGQEYYYYIEFDPVTKRIMTPFPEGCPY